MKEHIRVKTVYIIDQAGKFVGVASVPETEDNPSFITTPPPSYNSSTDTVFWDSNKKEWVVELSVEGNDKLWEQVISERNSLLASCDWAVLPDVEMSEEKKTRILRYRQILRDLPSMFSDPRDVKFPISPF